MKKIILYVFAALIISLFLSGCNLIADAVYQNSAKGHHLYYLPEFDNLDSPIKICIWMQMHGITYDNNDDAYNWKNPEDMIKSKKGSCADFAVLFLNIAHYGMHQNWEIVAVTHNSKKIEAGGITSNHAVCRYGDIIIDPQIGERVNYIVDYSYSFSEVFK